MQTDFHKFRDWRYIEEVHWEWFTNGGLNTYRSYFEKSDEDIVRHLKLFFNKLKYYHLENNKLFVHAGFDVREGFEATLQNNLDSILWERHLYMSAISHHSDGKGEKFGGFDKIYIGHTPTTYYDTLAPRYRCNVINLDQGCKIDGTLTVWVDETDECYTYRNAKEQLPS